MEKNNCVYEVSSVKLGFTDILNRLRKGTELVDKLWKLFRDNRANADE